MAERLRAMVAGRPAYLHPDCDVLEPGIVVTDYQVPDGMTLDDLYACAAVHAESEIVGVELAQLEADDDPAIIDGHVQGLLAALSSVFTAARTSW